MEIVIDVTRLAGRFMKGRLPTGVDRVSLEYIRHFGDRAHAMVRLGQREMILPRPASLRLFELLLRPSQGFIGEMIRLAVQEFPGMWNKGCLQGAFLFNTGHSGLERAAYPSALGRLGVRPIFFVHDLIPITYPEYCRRGESDKHVVRMNNVLDLACGVITNSAATLEELGNFAKKYGKPMPPSVTAPLASAALPPPLAKRPMTAPYFVVLGTIEPRKNHWLLLQVWRRLVEQMGTGAPRLVIIGQRGWECENVVDLLERCEALRGYVTELPACSDAELSTWLKHAQALLFPSFAEGYGIPLVEALSIGVPVIASDLPVFREIAGNIPDYLDPLDGMGWIGRIKAFAETASPERTAQLRRLASFSAPTWSTHFQVVEEFMERLQ